MTEADNTADLLQKALAEQDSLKARFEKAYASQETLEEIDLDTAIRQELELKQDAQSFLGRHIPTEIYNSWSVMNGPRRLRGAIEGWVNDLHQQFPPKPEAPQS